VNDPPYRYEVSHRAAEVAALWDGLSAGEESGDTVSVSGRVMLLRTQGKVAFAELRDSSGAVQLFAQTGTTDELDAFVRLNLGDWVGARGEVVRTRRGELSVKVHDWVLLAEARRSFGDKWRGVTDTETRYRQREVDLWANEESRRRLLVRSEIVRRMRERLWRRASSRWRRRSCTRSRAARWRGPSSPTTTRWTPTCTCGSRRSSS